MAIARPFKADWRTAYICQALRLSLTVAAALSVTPERRLFEANICRNYYRQNDPSAIDIGTDNITERLCKIAKVQQGVTDLHALLSGFMAFPTLFAVLPYLILCRYMNQKKLLLVNVFGILVMNVYYDAVLYFYNTFDPHWIVVVGIFQVIGGGYSVFNSVMHAVIARAVPPESLSSFNLYYSAIALIIRLAGSAAGLAMMQRSIWLPVAIALVIHTLAIPIVYTLFTEHHEPDSLHLAEQSYHLISKDESVDTVGVTDESEYDTEQTKNLPSRRQIVGKALVQFRNIVTSCHTPIVVMACYGIGHSLHGIIDYWISRRYGWELREVGWVQLGISLFTSILVASLPKLGKFCFSKQTLAGDTHSSASRDISLAQLCLLFYAFGSFILGLSWYRPSAVLSLAVMAAGHGFLDAYYSFLATWFATASPPSSAIDDRESDVSNLTAMYMVLSLILMMATSLGGWTVSQLYSVALGRDDDRNKSWATTLPIWFCAVGLLTAWRVSKWEH